MFGQLYVFTRIELGKTIALAGAISIIGANVLGYLFLREILTPGEYIGVMLAILAIIVLVLY
jgi:multidrug transporter EmrE-like cation transporter